MYFLSKLFLISDCKSSSAHIKPGLPQWLRLYCYLCSALNLPPMCLNLLSLVRATIKRVNSHSHTNHWRSGQDPQYPTISHSPGISVNTQRGQFIGEWNSYEDLAKSEAGCSAKLLLTHTFQSMEVNTKCWNLFYSSDQWEELHVLMWNAKYYYLH